jgi:ubiquinone biosynthesis protein UbiJ
MEPVSSLIVGLLVIVGTGSLTKVGENITDETVKLARSLWSFGRRAASNTVRNTAEYLAHENHTLVPRPEAEAFMADVDQLREDVDRAAARLRTLEET